MRKFVLLVGVAAAVVAVVAPVVPSAAGAATPAPVIQHWYAGVEAGTTTLGTAAGATCKPLLGTKVYLDLHVKVLKEWQRDPKALNRLGY